MLCEENLDYRFNNGQFEREGRLHTQKSIKRMGAILSNSELYLVRQHYNKALKFFGEKPIPDLTNCVKESMCALESCIEIITGKKASVNFTKAIRELQKSDLINIPPTITESIIKIYAFRGESQGVAHSSPEGSKVTETEAELILNLVAAYITYLVDSLLIRKEDIPF
ncbi:MAG: hypothetical protein JM58_03190 [Peptococcaceae bacterium BICA1-8]|nr:MAG: hypothetical protein JM58_03190 [Peptococcaceae bacterium BICA1-8]